MRMLDYLVTSRARRALLRLLWVKRVVAPVSELARQAGFSFSTTQRELSAMENAGLAVSKAVGNRVEYRANDASKKGALLSRLLTEEDSAPTEDTHEDSEVRAWLKAHGAPLAAPEVVTVKKPTLEEVLTDALRLSHHDAAVTRSLPVLLWRQREHVNWERLRVKARAVREDQTLGFFVELTGKLANNSHLKEVASSLRDHRRKKSRPFFDGPQGPHALALARRNTPSVAKHWGFTMNMPLDSFSSTFEKFAK